MRRLSLSTKLLVAALPLLVALGALLAINVRDSLAEVEGARRGAELGALWEPLIGAIRAVEAEQVASAGGDPETIRDARRATSLAMAEMNTVTRELGDSDPLSVQLGKALGSVSTARNATDNPNIGYTYTATADDFFDAAESELIDLGFLLPVEAGDRDLGRQLTAVAALAQIEQTGTRLVQLAGRSLTGSPTVADLERARVTSNELADAVGTFQAAAPRPWLDDFQESGLQRRVNDARRSLDQLIQTTASAAAPTAVPDAQQVDPLQADPATPDPAAEPPAQGENETVGDTAGDTAAETAGDADPAPPAPVTPTNPVIAQIDLRPLVSTMADVAEFRDARAVDIVIESDAAAAELSRQTMVRAIITGAAVLVAAVLAMIITRSITRRVRTVSRRAQAVATDQLPALVEALRDPRSGGALPEVEPIDERGSDELAELASSFNAVQSTLVDVANEQIEVLRRGVSDIFVTMARRNRSLVDRQLALLDELESEEHDHETLANYYRLDHLATRMRRNSESLLVLANAESRRRRAKATEIDDVVRAALGEVEEYQRIDVMHLDSLQVRGSAVAELSHLIAELLDNATAFSPPDRRVKVTGRFAGEEYLVRIIDEGVGIGPDRMAELNELLRNPPIIGLSVEPTLGMSVVSLLAAKHGVKVTVTAGSPGLVVDVVLPPSIYGPIDSFDSPAPSPVSGAMPAMAPGAGSDTLRVDALAERANGSRADDEMPPIVWPAERESAPMTPSDQATTAATPATPADTPAHKPMSSAERFEADSLLRSALEAVTSSPQPTSPTDEPGIDPAADPLTAIPELPRRTQHTSTSGLRLPDDVTTGTPVGSTVGSPVGSPAGPGAADVDFDSIAVEPAWMHLDQRLGEPADQTPVGAHAAESAGQAATSPLPPPSSHSLADEFSRPPAPPAFRNAASAGPLVDPSTMPLPSRRPEPPRHAAAPSPAGGARPVSTSATPASTSGLPMRSRSATPPPADPTTDQPSVAASSSPSALQAALAAFDAGRNGHAPTLPTRQPGANAGETLQAPATDPDAPPPSITSSRLDPEVIRDRLRAFHAESHSARADQAEPDDRDHGGDR